MREIRWQKEYPEMPEYMKDQLDKVISQELEKKDIAGKKSKQIASTSSKHYIKVAVAVLACMLVLSVTGVTLASMENGSFTHLTNLYFQEGMEYAKAFDNSVNENAEGNDESLKTAMEENFENEEIAEDKTPPEQFELDIEQYGMVLDNSYQGEGFSVNLKGLITDGYTGKLFYEIRMDDKSVAEKYEWLATDYIYSEDGLLISTGADTLLNKNGSSYNYVEFGGIDQSLYGTTITLKMDSVIGMLLNPSVLLDSQANYDCDLEIEIPIEKRSDMLERTYEVNENADFGFDGDGYVETITVTPLGIYFNCSSYQGKEVKGEYPWIQKVTFKDGSEPSIVSGCGFNAETCQGHMSFGYPVDPDEIASVQLGEFIYIFE